MIKYVSLSVFHQMKFCIFTTQFHIEFLCTKASTFRNNLHIKIKFREKLHAIDYTIPTQKEKLLITRMFR